MSEQPVAPEIESAEALCRWIQPLLAGLRDVSVTVFGDFCLDAYWLLDTAAQEHSVETGLPLRRVREQRYSLGGAGSVVANLSALGVGTVRVVGVAGADVFGAKLTSLLEREGAVLDGWFLETDLQTLVYAKPCKGAEEESRIDFGAFNRYTDSLRARVLQALESAVEASEAVVLNQQIPTGLTGGGLIGAVNGIIARHQDKVFLVDSRHFAAQYAGAAVKLNAREAAEILGEPEIASASHADAMRVAHRLQEELGAACFLTRGERGMIAVDTDGTVCSVPGIRIEGNTDTVGAGDAVMASLAVALARGHSAARAAQLANLAASITVRQLQQTGTATAQQVLQALDHLEYVPEHEAADGRALTAAARQR